MSAVSSNSGQTRGRSVCPLCAISGHRLGLVSAIAGVHVITGAVVAAAVHLVSGATAGVELTFHPTNRWGRPMSSQLEAKQPSHVKVATASLIGTAIEWYDFFLYGTAAALIFNKLFFPTFDPMVGTLLAFATYALGFVARPLGGFVFGHYGDRIGRKTMLYLTLLIMGVATTVIGLLPTYETLGVWAAILLIACRLIQGFGLGGEWGGAVLMAVEHAPEDR